MTHQPTATILPFPAPTPLCDATLSHMAKLEAASDHLSHLIEIETENVRGGANLSRRGGILSGRAIQRAGRLILYLIALRGNRESDRALCSAIRTWCNDWNDNA